MFFLGVILVDFIWIIQEIFTNMLNDEGSYVIRVVGSIVNLLSHLITCWVSFKIGLSFKSYLFIRKGQICSKIVLIIVSLLPLVITFKIFTMIGLTLQTAQEWNNLVYSKQYYNYIIYNYVASILGIFVYINYKSSLILFMIWRGNIEK